MFPTAFVVVLAAFLVQVSDAREITRARVDGLEEYIGRDVEEKDHSSSAQVKVDKVSPGNVGDRLHSESILKMVKAKGFWSTLWFVNVRLVKSGLAWLRELLAMPYYIFRISQYKAMILFGKA